MFTGDMQVKVAEVRKLGDIEVGYLEVNTKMTDNTIDIMIESGKITEEDIELLGGREALLAIPEAKQIQMGIIVDEDKFLNIVGTYYDDKDREEFLKAMKTIVQTAKVK